MVSLCLPSDALLQHLPSYLGFSYLGHGVSLHSCSNKAQPLLLTLDEGYLLTAAPPDLERGVVLLSPPAPVQPLLLGHEVAPLGRLPSKFGKLRSGYRTGKVFIPIPKKGNAKECSNYRTIALISHASEVILKLL